MRGKTRPPRLQTMVDIDEAELKKPTLSIDQPIHADLHDFLKPRSTFCGQDSQDLPLPAHRSM